MHLKRSLIGGMAAILVSLLVPFLGATSAVAARPMPLSAWGQPIGMKSKGVVITIHGGGWVSEGATYMRQQPTAIYRRAGWTTLNIDYRAGKNGIVDVVRFYDLVRSQVGPNVPICAAGQSAGGHEALMLAVYRPKLACVISEAGPAALTPLLQGYTVPDLYANVASIFTPAEALAQSPALHLRNYKGRILAAYSSADQIIPALPQLQALKAARSTTRAQITTHMLSSSGGLSHTGAVRMPHRGYHVWVHAYVEPRAYQAWNREQVDFLRDVAR